MGTYQKFRGNSENKLFYLIDGLYGGINTEYSDDVSQNGEFREIINFDLDKRGCLSKRKGFGKLTAISQIFNKIGVENLPEVRLRTEDYPNPENTNDNLVYMKLLKNENNCFRNLSAFTGDNAYRKYQEMYGFQHNKFELFMITTNQFLETSTAWLIKCELPELESDGQNGFTDTDTLIVSLETQELEVMFLWDRNLVNIDTLEYINKIYFLENNKGLMIYNRTAQTLAEGIEYAGFHTANIDNGAYKPTGLEVASIGFNVIGGEEDENPIYWINTSELDTQSIQGVVILSEDNIPLKKLPYSTNFKLGIVYTGTIPGETDLFTISMKSSVDNVTFDTDIQLTATFNSELSVSNSLAVYDIVIPVLTESYVEITVEKTGASIDPFKIYRAVGPIDANLEPVEKVSLAGFKVIDFYGRALYYKDNILWFSDVGEYTYIPDLNYVRLPLEPTDKIVKIVYFRNVYIVFTRFKIYKISGNDPFADDFSVTILNDSLGCCAANSVVQIENVLYFASDRGLYNLVSNYVTSTAMTFENVKELDDKVKTLTSNYTYYVQDIEDLSIRYNGISEKAVGLRYKDKYLLFYNTSFSEGDYAAENNIDVLSYNYDLKAFTTNRFRYKPNFLFMIDNVIETYATYPEKPSYTEEEHVLEYNLNVSSDTKKIVDNSGNGYDAEISAGVKPSPGNGVIFDGSLSYMEVGTINANISDGFRIDVDTEVTEVGNDTQILFDFNQITSSEEQQKRGSIIAETEEPDGGKFQLKFDYVGTPDFNEGLTKVEYTVTLTDMSDGNSAVQNSNCSYSVSDGANDLVNKTGIEFSIAEGSVRSIILDSGEFNVNHNAQGEYQKTWTLNFSAGRPTTQVTYTKGDSKSGSVTKDTNAGSWTKIGYSYSAVPNDGYCKLTISNVFFQNNDTIYQGSKRNIVITVEGSELTFPIAAFSSIGKHYSTQSSRSININYDSGTHRSTIGAKYNLVGTLGGVSYTWLTTDNVILTLPSIVKNTSLILVPYSGQNSYLVELTRVIGNVGRMYLMFDKTNNTIVFGVDRNSGTSFSILSNEGIEFNGNHTWSVDVSRSLPSSNTYDCILFRDGIVIGNTALYNYSIEDIYLDTNYIGSNKYQDELFKGVITNFYMYNYTSDEEVLEYKFTEGSGNTLIDSSTNRVYATLIDCVWRTEEGCLFNGVDSYLTIDELPSSINFTNGFIVEFDMKVDNLTQDSRILDLAKTYDIENSGNDKCSIAVGIKQGNVYLTSTGLAGNKFEMLTPVPVDGEVHRYKFTVVDIKIKYEITSYIDGIQIGNSMYADYKCISNTNRESNFIGRSNKVGQADFDGILYNMNIITYESYDTITYSPAIFEYDTSYTEFERPIEFSLRTKGYNLDYPQHIKKLKKIFIKLIGGYNYAEAYFVAYADGYRINDPGNYVASIDENGTVIYTYSTEENLKIESTASRLDNMELDSSRLGETIYQMDKFDTPAKCRNVSMEFYGESSDNIEIESIGIVCKLGKVKN